MKLIIITILITMLTACGGGDSDQNTDSNLSGTWRQTQIHKYYKADTNEYLRTSYIEITLIISKELDEIKTSSCWEYGKNYQPTTISGNNLTIGEGPFSLSYSLKSDGSYSTQEEKNIQDSGQPNTYLNRHFTLSKISNDVIIDKGLFVLAGPVETTQFNHICLVRHYANDSLSKAYSLYVPYDDDSLVFDIGFLSKLMVGPITYIRNEAGASLLDINIYSSSTAFMNIVGSNTMQINAADLNIIESTESILSGTFSFIDINSSENYSGEFQMELNN